MPPPTVIHHADLSPVISTSFHHMWVTHAMVFSGSASLTVGPHSSKTCYDLLITLWARTEWSPRFWQILWKTLAGSFL